MPRLLKKIHGDWQICDVAETPWIAQDEWRAGSALQVSVDAEPSTDWLDASSIAIDFPAMVGCGSESKSLINSPNFT